MVLQIFPTGARAALRSCRSAVRTRKAVQVRQQSYRGFSMQPRARNSSEAPIAPAETVGRSRQIAWISLSLLLATSTLAASLDSNSSPKSIVATDQGVEVDKQGLIQFEEVQKHNSIDDCWVVINGFVYDVTAFLQLHPGGQDAIIAKAGTDVSTLFQMLHPPNALENLPAEACLGPVDPATLPAAEEEVLTEAEERRQEAREAMPPAGSMWLLQDFEDWAEKVLDEMAWAYYRSAADEENTFHENRDAFRRYSFRPRVLRDTSTSCIETSFLGMPTSMPVFISPAAMAKLGHPLGEVNLTRAAGEVGIIQAISANASCSLEEMFEAKRDDQNLVFQIYLNKDRSLSESLLQKVDKIGAKAIIFTVDVLCQSKRTMDVRLKPAPIQAPSTVHSSGDSADSKPTIGVSQAIGGYQDRNLTWSDIGFIRRNTKLPIIVKGVQSLEDVELCVEHGVQGVIISNHGGRQADYAPAPIDILYEIRTLRPDLFNKIEIMIDGGVRSGADVVKALALGAKAVGIGRPILYANGTHGQDGVRRVLEILHEEITNTMCNIGASKLEDLKPEMVGPAGPWVGLNRPAYAPPVRKV